jgi:CDP-glycerol glycerophosphotransferase (TagB/SpsB family)
MEKPKKSRKIGMDVLYALSMVVNLLGYHLSGLFPRQKNRLLFGAWGGNKYSDNPRFLFEKLYQKNLSDTELIWVGKEHLRDLEVFKRPPGKNPSNIVFVKRNSIKSYYYQLTSDKAFFANSYRDFGLLNLLKGATIVQLWHGFGLKNTLAVKKDVSSMKKRYYRVGATSFEKYDYFISSSPANTKKILQSFKGNGITEEKIIPSGQPKNEYLIENAAKNASGSTKRREIRDLLYRKYGIPTDKVLFTYLPTFRDHRRTLRLSGLIGSQAEELKYALREANGVLLEKFHFADGISHQPLTEEDIYPVDAREDSTELLLATDVLITDYSSCYVDFSLLDRPIIHFLYDLKDYETLDRGLFYPMEKYKGGPIVTDLKDLFVYIRYAKKREQEADPVFLPEAREKVRRELMTYETGQSTETILKAIGMAAPLERK